METFEKIHYIGFSEKEYSFICLIAKQRELSVHDLVLLAILSIDGHTTG